MGLITINKVTAFEFNSSIFDPYHKASAHSGPSTMVWIKSLYGPGSRVLDRYSGYQRPLIRAGELTMIVHNCAVLRLVATACDSEITQTVHCVSEFIPVEGLSYQQKDGRLKLLISMLKASSLLHAV